MAKIFPVLCIVALTFAPSRVMGQDSIVVKQEIVPIEQMFGKNYKPSKAERESARETKRHNKELERELKKFRKDSPFVLGNKPAKQPKRARSIPPNANSY